MPLPLYRGYSTIGVTGVDTALSDINLVKQDLLNHFNTRLGERVGRPNFGTIIWDLLYDIQDDVTENAIIEDCKRIVRADPRVNLSDIKVNTERDAGTISVEMTLDYVELNMDSRFNLLFPIGG